jgi:hypothetical protein
MRRLLGVIGFVLLAGCSGKTSDLAKCDDALKVQLKAPSTYRRISVAEEYQAEKPRYTITYDAENTFGAPLRSQGLCYLSTDRKTVSAFP